MELLLWIQSWRTPLGDAIFSTATLLGESTVLILLASFILWCYDKSLGYRMGITYFISGMLVQGLKTVFARPRPWLLDSRVQPVEAAVPAASGYSFPSGHTQAAGSMLGTLAVRSRNALLRIVLCIIIFLVAFSRLYLGVHVPADVIVSMCIAVACIPVGGALISAVQKYRHADMYVALGLCVLSAALILCGWDGQTQAARQQFTNNINTACISIGFAVGWLWERRRLHIEVRAPLYFQLIKLIVGWGGLFAIDHYGRMFFVWLLGNAGIAEAVVGFLLGIWISGVYPLLFTICKKRLLLTKTTGKSK